MKRYMISVLTTFATFFLLTVALSAATPAVAEENAASSMALAQGAAEQGQVDINSASPKELRTLPGIGQAYSKKIIENRPYKTVEELRTRKVLPQGTYQKIREKVVAIGR